MDVGPSPTPYERAELLAAEAYGARRSWFLTNGATQGNHALCLALAPLGTHVVAQRNSHASVVDGLVLSGGRADLRRGRVRPGARDGARRHARGARRGARADARRARGVHRLADVLRHGGRRRRLRRGRARRGRARSSSTSRGARTSASSDVLPPSALELGADAVLTSTHKLAGSLTQSAILHLGPGDRIDEARVARAVRIVRSTSPSSLLLASLDAARRQLAVHGEQLLHETVAAIGAAREKLRADRRASSCWTRSSSAARASPPTTRCGSSSTCAGPAAPVSSSRTRCARATTCTPSSRRSRRSCFVVGIGRAPAGAAARSPATSRRPSRACAGRAPRPSRSTSRPRRRSWRSPRATPSSATPSRSSPSPRPSAAISCESIAGYPPGIPALLPGERVTRGDRALPDRDRRRRAGASTGPATRGSARCSCCARADGPAQRTSSTGLPTAPPSANPASSRAPSSSGAVSLMIGMSLPSAHHSRRSACAAAGNSWSIGSMPP